MFEEVAGIYIFHFFYEVDLEDAMDVSPCTFSNHLPLLNRLGSHGSPSKCR